jgi:hypothetical protein
MVGTKALYCLVVEMASTMVEQKNYQLAENMALLIDRQ